MSLTYLPSIGKYISERYLWTDDELDAMQAMEKEWRQSVRRPGFHELIEMFPQGKSLMRRHLKETIRQCESDLATAERERRDMEQRIADWRHDPKDNWMIEAVGEELFIKPLIEGRQATIKRSRYYLSLITRKKKGDVFDESNAVLGGVAPDMIEAARSVPIETLIEFNRSRNALCVFHTEKTPSMHLFPDNHVWCFSCAKGGDAISVMRGLHDIGFVEAVKKLTGTI